MWRQVSHIWQFHSWPKVMSLQVNPSSQDCHLLTPADWWCPNSVPWPILSCLKLFFSMEMWDVHVLGDFRRLKKLNFDFVVFTLANSGGFLPKEHPLRLMSCNSTKVFVSSRQIHHTPKNDILSVLEPFSVPPVCQIKGKMYVYKHFGDVRLQHHARDAIHRPRIWDKKRLANTGAHAYLSSGHPHQNRNKSNKQT